MYRTAREARGVELLNFHKDLKEPGPGTHWPSVQREEIIIRKRYIKEIFIGE